VLEHAPPLPGAAFAALCNQVVRPLLFAPFAAIAVVFPDGRLPSARWRRVAIAAAASFAFLQVLLFLAPRELDEPFDVVSSPLPQLAYLRAADAG